MGTLPKLEWPEAREYKLLLNPNLLSLEAKGFASFGSDLQQLLRDAGFATYTKKFVKAKQQAVRFLDTADFQLRRFGLLLRERVSLEKKNKVELTLKCRSHDPLVAIAHDPRVPKGIKFDQKLEEDICPKFSSRFSRSTTIFWKDSASTKIEDLAKSFAVLRDLGIQGELVAVNDHNMVESVWKGPTFRCTEKLDAEWALILWQRKNSKHLAVSELSFRLPIKRSLLRDGRAASLMELFGKLQRPEWLDQQFTTKTEWIYSRPHLEELE